MPAHFTRNTGTNTLATVSIIHMACFRKVRRLTLLFITLLFTCPLFAGDPPILTIPFESTGKAIWLPVRINGSAPQNFLFDTGAGATVINRSRAAALGLRISGDHLQANAGAGNDPTLIGTVSNVVFELSPSVRITLPASPVIALDDISRLYGAPMDGIIGSDLTKRYVVVIDYDARKLTLYDPAGFHYEGNGAVLPIEVKRGLSYIRATVSVRGRSAVEGRFMIDSPILNSVVFTAPFNRAHRLQEGSPKLVPHRTIGVGGTSMNPKGRLDALSIGPFTIPSPVAHFPADHGGTFARRDMAGAFGAEVLRRFRFILDYSRSRIILEPNAHLKEAWLDDAAGITLRCDGDDYRAYAVDWVVPQSPAHEAGIREGDLLVAINGTPTREMTLWEIQRMLQLPGREVNLRIKGPAGTREARLTTRELLIP